MLWPESVLLTDLGRLVVIAPGGDPGTCGPEGNLEQIIWGDDL